MITNPDYCIKITEALHRAAIQTSYDPANNTATLLAAEVIEACITLMAFVLAGSDECDSPTSSRKTCQAIAKGLQERIRVTQAIREDAEADGTSVVTDVNRIVQPQ